MRVCLTWERSERCWRTKQSMQSWRPTNIITPLITITIIISESTERRCWCQLSVGDVAQSTDYWRHYTRPQPLTLYLHTQTWLVGVARARVRVRALPVVRVSSVVARRSELLSAGAYPVSRPIGNESVLIQRCSVLWQCLSPPSRK